MLHDPNLEAGLVAAAMTYPETIAPMAMWFDPEDVHDERKRAVIEALFDLDAAGSPVDMVTLYERLRSSGKAKLVGDLGGLTEMSDATYVSRASVERHAQQLRKWADARRVGQTAAEIAEASRRPVDEPGHFTDWASSTLGQAFRERRKLAAHAGEIAESEIERIVSMRTVPAVFTPWKSMNQVLATGLEVGTQTVICARPAVGKTSFAMDIADNAASRTDVLVFSLEMGEGELIRRRLSARSGVAFLKLSGQRRLSGADEMAIKKAAHEIKQGHLVVDDTQGISISEIRARARVWRRGCKDGLTPPLILIDYLQLAKGDGRSREEEVSSISRGCKEMSKELDVAVVALSQLNRESEKRADGKPKLSDLRESGAIEQDADKVIGLWRESTNAADKDKCKVAQAIVLKNRQGCTGVAELSFSGPTYTFSPQLPTEEPPPPTTPGPVWSKSNQARF